MPRSRRRPPYLVALLAVSVWPSPSIAEDDGPPDVGISVTNTTVAEYRADNGNGNDTDDTYGVLLDRLNAKATVGDLAAYARVDANGFIHAPSDQYRTQIRLERVGMSYRLSGWSFTVGDYYEQIGRGLSLSMRKLPEAGVDVSIFGARTRYVGDHHSVTALVGRANAANIDSVSQKAVDDQHDLMAAARYELTPSSSLRAGFYGVYMQPEESVLPDDFQDLSLNAGTYVELPALLEWATGYLEVAVQERFLAGQPQHGAAAYLTGEARFFDLALVGEALLLSGFEQLGSRNSALANRFVYNRPPTLERIDQEVTNSRDVAGVRGRLEYFFFDWSTLIYGNAMLRFSNPLEDHRLVQVHAYAGIDSSYDQGASRIAGALGYRHEQQANQDEPVRQTILLDVDWLHQLGWGLAVHATTQSQFRRQQSTPWFWGSTFVGVEKAGVGGLTFELGYDTLSQLPGRTTLFYALIGQWEINERLTVRGTVGSQRGGIKCVAGVCREWPAFSGVQSVLISRF